MKRILGALGVFAMLTVGTLTLPQTSQAASPYPWNTAIVATVISYNQCGPTGVNTYPTHLCKQPTETIKDSLGYWNRECGSYAAWMEQSTGHNMPARSVMGAVVGDWPQNVPASWIVTTPQVGDVAIRPESGIAGDTGHAMYITAIGYDGDPTALVVNSYNIGETGDFTQTVWTPTGTYYGIPFSLVFIQFPAAVSPQPRI